MPRLHVGGRVRPSVRGLSVVILASALAIAGPALAQISRPEPQSGGSARVTGRVLASDNAAPVRRALVRLSGSPDAVPGAGPKRAYIRRSVETDDNGAFDFADLPGGSYSVDVFPINGFVPLARGRRAVVGEGRALDVSIRLERTGAIVGRIADKHDEGVMGVEVHALRRGDFRGHVTLVSVSRVLTDDLGQFRLFNLPAAEYVVAAAPVHSRAVSTPHDPETTRRSGFVTTYYPGTQAPGDARVVSVRAGRDSARVNFLLASGRLATVA